MAEMVRVLQRLAIQFGAVFWYALLLFGLLALGVIYVLPAWMIAIIVVAGFLIGLLTYTLCWMMRRNNPSFSPRKTLLAHAFGGVLAAMDLAVLPIYAMAFWVTSGPTSLPLSTRP